jgi:trigger factor
MVNVVTEELEYCKIKVNYTADIEIFKEKTKEAIKKFRNNAVPGFRPGKATDAAIKTKYSKQIKDVLLNEMIQLANEDILFETKMRPLGQPQLVSANIDNNFKCEFIYNKKPDIELKNVREMEIPNPKVETTSDQIRELYLQGLREQCGENVPYGENDFIQTGDKVILDYSIQGDEPKVGVIYDVGSNAEIGLDDNIVGMTPGEVRKFTIERGENRIPTEVTLQSGMKKTPCPLDDSLAVRLGKKDYNELLKDINATAEKQAKIERDRAIAQQIRLRLVAEHNFEVPQWLVLNESKQIAAHEGAKWDDLTNEAKEKILDRGKDQVKFALLVDSVIEKEPEAQLSDEETFGLVRQRVSEMTPNVEQFLTEAMRSGRIQQMFQTVKNDYAMQWLVDNCKVVE